MHGPVAVPVRQKVSALFRRSQPATPAQPTEQVVKPGGKGRPTPSRKEAEAAARARAKTPRTRKEMAAAERARRAAASNKVREAMKTGDERYLPARDRGPVRRFIRDFVDVRFSFTELLIPVMLVTLVLSWTGNPTLMSIGELVLLGSIVMILFDLVFLRIRLRAELKRRFPEASYKGTTFYAVMRALQMKFLRMPKAQVKIGDQLPESYH